MNRRELNVKVTAAIFRAEHLVPGSLEADAAYREVSHLEAEIAREVPPDDIEGAIARRGAITAAISARDWLRAVTLVETYLSEGLPTDLAAEVTALREQAEAELSRQRPEVKQVRFELRAA